MLRSVELPKEYDTFTLGSVGCARLFGGCEGLPKGSCPHWAKDVGCNQSDSEEETSVCVGFHHILFSPFKSCADKAMVQKCVFMCVS